MAYIKNILFDLVSDSIDVGNIVSSITDDTVTLEDQNVYYRVDGPLGVMKQEDFLIADGVIPTGGGTANMPNVVVPLDSDGCYYEGSYKITFYMEFVSNPGVYLTQECSFVLDVKNQGLDNCKLSGVIDFIVNCHCYEITVKDMTNYAKHNIEIIDRLITVIPPTVPGQATPAEITTDQLQLSFGFGYSNVTYDVNLDVTYEHSYCDGELIVREDIKQVYSEKVVCDYNLCKLFTCIESKFKELAAMIQAKDGIANVSDYYKDEWFAIYTALTFHNQFVECKKWDKVDEYYNKLVALTGCDCGCDPSNVDTPVPVSPDCGGAGGTITSITGNAPVLVNQAGTSAIISLDPGFVTQAQKGVIGTSPVVVTDNGSDFDVSLEAATIAKINASITDVTIDPADASYLSVTSPTTDTRQISLAEEAFNFGAYTTMLNVDSAFPTFEFEAVPNPLRFSVNQFLGLCKFSGAFIYNDSTPNLAICLSITKKVPLSGPSARGSESIGCYNPNGDQVGTLKIYKQAPGDTEGVFLFVHNSKYTPGGLIYVDGVSAID